MFILKNALNKGKKVIIELGNKKELNLSMII